jgi:hypothetical protein
MLVVKNPYKELERSQDNIIKLQAKKENVDLMDKKKDKDPSPT